MTVEEMARRALDYAEIQNVMAAHVYYYRAQKQTDELERFWSKTKEDLVYAHNERAFEGRAQVYKYYSEANDVTRKEKLDAICKVFPEVENKPENLGMGDLVAHILTTPYIEIAGDGRTAKGVWYSPGLCSSVGADGHLNAMRIWEKYGVDFIREEDGWKIWHFCGYIDFMMPVDGTLLEAGVPGTAKSDGKRPDNPDDKPNGKMPMPFVSPNKMFRDQRPFYSPTTVADFYPPMPEPYGSWEDTFSYAEDREQEGT